MTLGYGMIRASRNIVEVVGKLLGSCWEVVGVVTSTCQGFYMLLHCTVCKGMTE